MVCIRVLCGVSSIQKLLAPEILGVVTDILWIPRRSHKTLLILLLTPQVPNHLATIDGLYRLLKPGGRFLVCEHVLQPYPNSGDFIASLLQKLYMALGWSFWVGGCCLDRDIDAALREVAGSDGWDEIKATYLSTYSTVPYLVGEYVKST